MIKTYYYYNLTLLLKQFVKIKDKEPINTVVITLQDNYQEVLQGHFSINQKLIVDNLESYYNYRTIDSDFKRVSSVLSDRENFIPMPIQSNSHYNNF